LRALAEALDECKRSSDLAARFGGDEFVVVLTHTDRAGARGFISRVEEELRRPVMRMADGEPLASFGIATLGEQGWDERVEDLLERADAELYEQKAAHHGRT
jgi:diguanylate cyclase (GGDEF)-like protein